MPILMRSTIVCLLFSLTAFCQFIDQNQAEDLLSDLTNYSKNYISPASESIVYQAASGWMLSPQKKEDWQFTLGIHTNVFVTPQKNRQFTVNNNDFRFFELYNFEDVPLNGDISVPTVLGSTTDVYLTGDLDVFGNPQRISLKMDGVNQEVIVYPYLQGSLALPHGFELLGKFSFKNRLKRGEYQVYGLGLQYNISQHFGQWKNFNLATQFIYNNEFISVDFVQSFKSEVDVGLRSFNTTVHSFQWAISASREFNKFEAIAGFLVNQSNFEHYFLGERVNIMGVEADFIEIFNSRLDVFTKKQTLLIAEISGRYQFALHWYAQSTLSFGKLLNSNFGVQYVF